ncbi:enoyl-CoA hydratase [Bordetella hinzii]|uniref:Enoyl-CoA hydratase/isomerase family protein n=1 Tax=Bordetella hinzii OH87 BAL007II TaxID=1331262 RepID=A0ABR4R599_9BORD|nr:enoyl-CoA hydratase [Bordetella hinzii]AKQ55740.1 putative enoyl-CoA hydratase echA8 [Bordetella hinzii]KCB25348.1 enoyl-CoA hydratase/isomerase family protein [Bordetella hinzii OH87 BAL007II]KCB32792.1 enoyl-CoA hydratase/isomerase family protein [Bordetella hinzii L60]KCB44403.1 enoyl-CoA hydratase/isomerase family protein [Bordetella hinzii 5132]QDJ43270.1 enoyl-CoA hydratase [Bordetella hinzii]
MTTQHSHIRSELRQGALWILFDRPEARNAMTSEMEKQVLALCRQAAEDDAVKAVVFTGAAAQTPAFMAGADFGALESASTAEEFVELERSSEALLEAIERLPKPTIAAIAGACVGQGALLAMCCDLRIATPSLKFGFPIARTVGNCLSAKNYARLTDNLGAARVRDMVFSAKLLGAAELREAGAIREVLAEDALHTRAQEMAEQVQTLAPLTLWATRSALLRLRDAAAEGVADDDLLSACYMSADFQEGVRAFLEKRKPVWSGR